MKVLVSVLSLLVVILDQSAYACSCYSKLGKEEALRKSDVAVLTKVVNADPTSIKLPNRANYNGPERSISASKYTLETIEQFKGSSTTHLETLSRKTSCFVDLEPGREYVLYLRNGVNGSIPEIDACDRVLPAENSSDDLEYLRHQ